VNQNRRRTFTRLIKRPRIRSFGRLKKQTEDPSVRENKKEASSHLQGGETIVLREGNRKDVPSEMRNGFVRLFVCLFVCGFALRASTKLWRGVPGGCLYLCSGAYKVIYCFWAIFRPRGGSLKGRKIFGAKKTLACFKKVRFWAFLCFRLPLVL